MTNEGFRLEPYAKRRVSKAMKPRLKPARGWSGPSGAALALHRLLKCCGKTIAAAREFMVEIFHPDELEKKRRRGVFILASSFGMLLILVFSTIDYLEGDTLELAIDVSMGAILVFSAVGIYE